MFDWNELLIRSRSRSTPNSLLIQIHGINCVRRQLTDISRPPPEIGMNKQFTRDATAYLLCPAVKGHARHNQNYPPRVWPTLRASSTILNEIYHVLLIALCVFLSCGAPSHDTSHTSRKFQPHGVKLRYRSSDLVQRYRKWYTGTLERDVRCTTCTQTEKGDSYTYTHTGDGCHFCARPVRQNRPLQW